MHLTKEPEKAMECYRTGLNLSAGADTSTLPSQEGELIKAGDEETRLAGAATETPQETASA